MSLGSDEVFPVIVVQAIGKPTVHGDSLLRQQTVSAFGTS